MKRGNLPKQGGQGALKILEEYYITDPTTIDLEDLILDKGGFVEEKPIKGAQGRIMVKNGRAIITVNSNIKDPNRKRFVLAHEFGHFMLHSKNIAAFSCDVNDFVDWQGTRPEEAQANRFAANLLMPPKMFKQECDGKPFSIDNIEALSIRFKTSFMSTAIRFAEHGNFPCVVVYSKDGFVEWAAFSKDFPTSENQLNYIRFGSRVPVDSVAHDIFSTKEVPNEPFKVKASEWFPECFDLEYFKNWEFYEECRYYAAFNSVMSFIYTY